MVKDEQKEQPIDTWAKIKFDIQIVSIAKAEGVSVIYSEDPHIEALAKRVGVDVRRICDLALPEDRAEEDNLFSKLPNEEVK